MYCPDCGTKITMYRNPTPTVDIIIEINNGIVLIERKNPPLGWALPGGFVDYGEAFEHAAHREAEEETGLQVRLISQFHTYSHPERDARQHTASTVFIGQAEGEPVGADDAAQAGIFYQENLPKLVFDHQQILKDYFHFKKTGERPGI
ncbi:MAG: NUDIX hydrolase [Desulfobulbus propionicus]|nr:MAG: NUDIX hydrolase [Desulfobulbus propionicus]